MSKLTSNERLERIAAFVKARLKEVAEERGETLLEADPLYRWQHTLRVCNYGKLLAEAEGANVELVVAGCLLHDVAVFDTGERKDHGRLGAEIARPLLRELGYSPVEVENICYSIASHVDVADLQTLEAKIVTDADNIDRFGAYRAFLWCLRYRENYNRMVLNLTSRLRTLREYREKRMLETSTGNVMFNDHLDFQIEFFDRIVKENDWTVLPKI
jgi:uncharacterized protein